MHMTELSLRSQQTDEKQAKERGTTHRVPFTLSLSVSIVLIANSVTAAQPALHLPYGCNSPITGIRRERCQYNFGFKTAVWPTTCGISAILRPLCQGIGSLGCWSQACIHIWSLKGRVVGLELRPLNHDQTQKNRRCSAAVSDNCYSDCYMTETRRLLFTMKFRNKTQQLHQGRLWT